MAATPTATALSRLAGFSNADGAALSVYLDLDPSVTATPADVESRVRSALDEAGRARPDAAGHAARTTFDAGLERLRELLTTSDVHGSGVSHGAAVFACGDAVLEAHGLWRSAGDLVHVGRRFALGRMAAQASRTSRILLLLASRELGRLRLLREGELIDLTDASDDVENRHHAGGSAQSKLQRHADREAELRLAEVVDLLERVHARIGRPPVVVSASDETAAVVRERSGQEVAAATVARIANARDLPDGELLEELARIAHERDQAREEELLGRLHAQAGRGENDGGLGAAALAAVSEGRTEWLLLSSQPSLEVWSCEHCDLLAAAGGTCPLDGAPLRRDEDGVEAAVAATLRAGGSVWQLLDVDRRDLDSGGGVGVITRY